MKRLTVALLIAALLCTCAFADTVFVTIADANGKLALAAEPIDVPDLDDDGTLTLFDALTAAHDAAFDGGAAAGFAASDDGYGLSIRKLWGTENGSSYGYYINNASAFSLLDSVQEGDALCAFVYTDLAGWSDTYCYFDTSSIKASGSFTLTLHAFSYDADWNAVSIPLEDAVITIDGVDTLFKTDAEGKAEISIEAEGRYIISARSDNMILVPPVCIAEIG